MQYSWKVFCHRDPAGSEFAFLRTLEHWSGSLIYCFILSQNFSPVIWRFVRRKSDSHVTNGHLLTTSQVGRQVFKSMAVLRYSAIFKWWVIAPLVLYQFEIEIVHWVTFSIIIYNQSHTLDYGVVQIVLHSCIFQCSLASRIAATMLTGWWTLPSKLFQCSLKLLKVIRHGWNLSMKDVYLFTADTVY